MSKIIHNHLLPFGNFLAINLCGLIFVRHGVRLTAEEDNHERIHTRQQIEMLIIPFYIWYVAEWLIKLIKYRSTDKAYYAVSFEREAYANMKDLSYLKRRKRFAWTKFLK